MSYSFYTLAKQQPDLQDVIEYLNSPLTILEELGHKILICNQKNKNILEINDIQHSVDNIVNKHLPELIEKYCELSLNYRNTFFIKEKIENKQVIKYTAKDLLLINIGKITEEVQLLEQKFNDVNSYNFLVKSRIISDLGLQPQIIELESETNDEQIILKNQFDYSNFKKSCKNTFLTKKNSESISFKNEKTNKKNRLISPFYFIHIPLLLTIYLLFSVSLKILERKDNEKLIYNVGTLSYMIKNLYASSRSYDSLNTNVLISSRLISSKDVEQNDSIAISNSTNIQINPTTLNYKNDSFKISMKDISYKSCNHILSNISAPNSIIINEHVVSDFASHINESLTYCTKNNIISFIYK